MKVAELNSGHAHGKISGQQKSFDDNLMILIATALLGSFSGRECYELSLLTRMEAARLCGPRI